MAVTRTVFIDTTLSDYPLLAAQYDPNLFNVVLLDNTSPHADQIGNWLSMHQASADDINIVSASAGVNDAATSRVVFIDPGVADIGTVIAGVPANATVVVLDASRDGVQQIQDYLAANHVDGLASVDIVSHGSAGEITLGSTVLNGATMAAYASQLAAIGSHLAAGADLQLYGCDVASGETGQQFITALAAATGADVAASTDLTGGAAAGGNWVLEASTGTIETAALNIAGYADLLDAASRVNTITFSSDSGSSSSDLITNVAVQTISGTFSATVSNGNGGNGNGNGNGDAVPTIYVSLDGGTTRTLANVTYVDNAGSGTFTANVTLAPGAGKTIQFWNAATNGTQIGSWGYTYDNAAPGAPTISGFSDNSGSTSDNLTNDRTPTLTISAEADATVEVFRGGVSVGVATQTAPHSGIYTFTSASLGDGNYAFTAKATDVAGNTSLVSASQTISIDGTAPGAPVITGFSTNSASKQDTLTNDTTPTLTITAQVNSTVEVFMDGVSVGTATQTAPGSGSYVFTSAVLGDGSYNFTARATDAAGNTSLASAAQNVTVDNTLSTPTVSLVQDTGTSGSDHLTNNASLNIAAADAGASRVITVDGRTVSSYDPTALQDGSHTVTVTDSDAAGNSRTASLSFTLDTTLTTPTITLAQDAGTSGSDRLTNNANLNIGAADAGATRVITVDGRTVSSYDPAALQDGSHNVTVTDSDAAGNSRTASLAFTLDTVLPTPTVGLVSDTGTSGSDHLTRDARLNFGALESGASRVIKVDGNAVSAYDASTLAQGAHTVVVEDTDAAGNVGTSSVSFTLDTVLPTPSVGLANDTGSSGTDHLTNNAGLIFGALESGASRVIKVDGNVVNAYDASTMAQGAHTVVVEDTDAAGNVGTSSVSFTLDTVLPTPSVGLASDTGNDGTDHLTNNAGLIFGALETGASRVIKVDGNAVNAYDASTLAQGSHTVVVEDTDAAGNVGTSSVSFTLDTVLPTPTVGLMSDTGASGSDHLTNNAGLNIGALETGASRVIKVDGNAVNTYDASTLAQGAHTVVVEDTDAAGNVGTSSVNFTLDTVLPTPSVGLANDTGSSGTDHLTNNAGLIFGALETGASRVIKVDGNAVNAYDASSLAQGAHTVVVEDTDAAGNVGTSSVSFTLDTVLPTPTVGLVSDTGASGTDHLTNNAGLIFGALETGASRVIKVDGNAVNAYDASSLAQGAHTVVVEDTDAAGNVGTSSVSFTLDTVLPPPTVGLANDTGASGSDHLTNNAGLIFGALETGASRVIKIDGNAVNAYDASTLSQGAHTVTVEDTDAAGNVGTSSVSFTLDTVLPTPTVGLMSDTGTSGSDHLTNNAGLIFGALESGASRVIKVDGNAVNAYDASTLSQGAHTVTVEDTDAAGNVGTNSVSFTLDSNGPVFSSGVSVTIAENSGANQVVYRAAASDASAFTYSLGAADAAKFAIAADGSVTLKENPNFEDSGKPTGFTVVTTDAAGNHTERAVTLNITNVNEAPVATTVSKSTCENTAISFGVADNVSDPDAGDRFTVSLNTTSSSLTWANADPTTSTSLINPVTRAAVDLSTLSVKASVAADGTVTLTPPAELDWMVTNQTLKATFTYTVTDAGGLTSTESINLVINGSTNDKGVNLNGGNGDDTLLGNVSNNAEDVISGGNGNDTLYGYGGTDALYGGNGDDRVYGGAGIDYLYGDSGNDTIEGGSEGDFIFGGKGNDILSGGTGADKFVFAPQGGTDRITDFKLAEGDKLYFADIFTTAPTVDEAFLSRYVTDTGNDLVITLPGGTSVVLVGVLNATDLLAPGVINFTMPV